MTDVNDADALAVLVPKEHERLREIEDIRRFDGATAARQRGESDAIPWEQAKHETEMEREELRRRGEA